jgi:hypothetical protein
MCNFFDYYRQGFNSLEKANDCVLFTSGVAGSAAMNGIDGGSRDEPIIATTTASSGPCASGASGYQANDFTITCNFAYSQAPGGDTNNIATIRGLPDASSCAASCKSNGNCNFFTFVRQDNRPFQLAGDCILLSYNYQSYSDSRYDGGFRNPPVTTTTTSTEQQTTTTTAAATTTTTAAVQNTCANGVTNSFPYDGGYTIDCNAFYATGANVIKTVPSQPNAVACASWCDQTSSCRGFTYFRDGDRTFNRGDCALMSSIASGSKGINGYDRGIKAVATVGTTTTSAATTTTGIPTLQSGGNGLQNPSFETVTNDGRGYSTLQAWTPSPTDRATQAKTGNAEDGAASA